MNALVSLVALWFSAVQAPVPPQESVGSEVEKLRSVSAPAEAAPILDALLARHLDADELATAAQHVARRHKTLAGERFLREVAANSKSEKARGFATWALAQLLIDFDAMKEFLADPQVGKEHRDNVDARRGTDLIPALEKRDRAELQKDACAQLRKVVDDYFLLEWRPTGYLGAAADMQLFELERLQIGMVAPEIEGEDEDGVPFKLTDYRGKVVALDFWGFWCPICVRNLPPEREMVERLKDQPFALVGVNSDPKDRLIVAAKHERIAWRSFFDGGDAYGPIARRWNVTSWPTIYVLDEEGVIHLKTEDADEVAKKVDELLARMNAKAKQASPAPKSTRP